MTGSLQSLSREQCLDRLRSRSVGRIAITHQALPAIVPVNYTLLGSDVVFRTEPGGMLARACENSVVAFEVDDLAVDGGSGWSVAVVGVAAPLAGGDELRAVESRLVSAAGGNRDLFVAITIGQLTGRAVERAFNASADAAEPFGVPA